MDSLFAKYGRDKLYRHYKCGALTSLPGIGKQTEQKIKTYFNKEKYDIFTELKSKFNSVKLDFKNETDKQNFYKMWCWLKSQIITKQIKENILKYWSKNNGSMCPNDIEKNPMLLTNIKAGFKKIDWMALKNNWWKENDYYRYECIINYMFEQKCQEYGHTYLTKLDISTIRQYDNLNISQNMLNIFIKRSIEDGKIRLINECYILNEHYEMEKEIANVVLQIKDLKYAETKYEKDEKITDEQVRAINGIMSNPLTILQGRGGTGKTSCVVKSICDVVKQNIIFCAPTHAAKKNGMNIIGKQRGSTSVGKSDNIRYCTLQSLTCYNKLYDILSTKSIKYIFVDEISMVGLEDFYKLMYNCKSFLNATYGLHIVLIGDHNQLEPIGIGNPFLNLIDKIPTYKLSKNFRSINSDIVQFCDKILGDDNSWTLDETKEGYISYKNVHYNFKQSEDKILNKLLDEFKKDGYVPYCGDDNTKTFQVIACDNKKCEELCPIIRNKYSNIYNISDNKYEIKDPVIMRKNTTLFKNGDMAIIDEILDDNYYNVILVNEKEQEQEPIENMCDDIKQLNNGIVQVHADYIKPSLARTVHSSQGLEFAKVIYFANSFFMVNKKINYTAYSRAKEDLYLIGNMQNYNGIDARRVKYTRNTLLPYFLDNKIVEQKDISDDYRKQIPKSVMYDVWIRDMGDSAKGRCFVNNKHKVKISNFHCGHIISVRDGGSNLLSNLKVICSMCNLSMGVH